MTGIIKVCRFGYSRYCHIGITKHILCPHYAYILNVLRKAYSVYLRKHLSDIAFCISVPLGEFTQLRGVPSGIYFLFIG